MNKVPPQKNWRFLSPIHQVNNSAPGWLHLESYIILYRIASYHIILYHITCTSSRQTMVTGCPGTRFTATSWPSASRKDATTPSKAVARSPDGLEADWHLIGKHPRLKYFEKIMRVEGFINWCSKLSIQHYQEEISTCYCYMCHISKRPLVKGSRHSCHCPGASGTDTWWSVPMMALQLFFASNPRGGPRRQLKTARVYCQDLRKQNSFWTTKCLTKSDFDFVTLKVVLQNLPKSCWNSNSCVSWHDWHISNIAQNPLLQAVNNSDHIWPPHPCI